MRLPLAAARSLPSLFGVALAVAMLAAALCLPGAAEAKPGYYVQDRSLHLEMKAEASNGYRLTVETAGHREVALTVSRGSTFAIYRTSGRVSRHGIEADFGELGRIAVRFDGKQRAFNPLADLGIRLPPGLKLPHRDCRGKRPVREVGSFHGTIRFRGENDFTRLRTRRARGEVHRFYRRVCKRGSLTFGRRPGSGPSDERGLNMLVVVDRSQRPTVRLEAISFELGPNGEELEALLGTLAIATARERREGLRIVRAAFVFGDDGSLLVSPRKANPITAEIALPAPIPGTAKYTKEVGAPGSWVGSLKASLPGAGPVPLTGPSFSATLCRFPIDESLSVSLDNRCLRRSGAALPPSLVVGTAISAQISGSQSQLFGDARLSWSR